MARPRKPTGQLEDTGAFDHDPKRKDGRKNEPKSNGPIGDPPVYFDEAHRAIWFELIDESPNGVLTKADRKHLELASRLTAKMRLVPGRMSRWLTFLGDALIDMGMSELDVMLMKQDFYAAVACKSSELSLLATTLTRMGMTPADRSRVQGDTSDESEQQDPLGQLDAIFNGGTSPKSLQ